MPPGRISKSLAICFFTFVVLSAPLTAQRRLPAKSGIDAERLARVPVRLRSFVDKGAMAGAVALIARRGEIAMLEAVGYQDIDSKKPMRTDTIFDIRSVTKPITAIGIMILVEEGRLALNNPVEKYLPEFKNERNKFPRITIHHLLTHTSALPLYRLPESNELPIKRNRTLTDYVSFLSRQEPEYEPGTKFRYSSGGFAILGRVIEVVSGKSFEQFMQERIFQPLGMKDSFFFVPAEKQHRLASIYRWGSGGALERWEELETHARSAKYPGPEFGMYSTATDLAAVCQMMLNGGTFKGQRILSPMSVNLMTANHTLNLKSATTQTPAYQGLGWGLHGDPMNDFPLTTPGSFGHNGAFGAIVWVDPDKELIRIFLEHRFGFNNESNLFMAMAGATAID
jgi:CubicO group peptidase (beta-lactamase class C family)